MAQHKIEDVDPQICAIVAQNQATNYYLAMSFQFGCAIGELIGMGIEPEEIRQSFEEILAMAVKTKRRSQFNG